MYREPVAYPPESLHIVTTDAWGRIIDQQRGLTVGAHKSLCDALKRAEARGFTVSVRLSDYEPCSACAKERAQREAAPEWGRWDDYWCNDCQASGWCLVPWKRLPDASETP